MKRGSYQTLQVSIKNTVIKRLLQNNVYGTMGRKKNEFVTTSYNNSVSCRYLQGLKHFLVSNSQQRCIFLSNISNVFCNSEQAIYTDIQKKMWISPSHSHAQWYSAFILNRTILYIWYGSWMHILMLAKSSWGSTRTSLIKEVT